MGEIKVLVASDSALLREGIQALLSPCSELEVVGETAVGDEAIEEACRLQPRVLILDVPNPDTRRLDLLARLKRRLPDLRVITVSYQQDEATILGVLQMGVQGYLCGREGAAELIAAVQAVAGGDSFLCPAASGALLRHYRRRSRKGRRGKQQ